MNEQCLGVVEQPDGTTRPCRQDTSKTKANGYCTNHQNQAAQAIIDTMESIYEQIQDLRREEGDTADARNAIEAAKANLRNLGVVCDSNPDCRSLLSNVVVELRLLASPLGRPPETESGETLEELAARVENLSQTTNNDVQRVVNDALLAAKQGQNADATLGSLEGEQQAERTRQRRQERGVKDVLKTMVHKLKATNEARLRAEEKVEALTRKIEEGRASQMVVEGDCTKELLDQQHKVRALESMNETLIAREFALGKSLAQLQQSQKNAADMILQVKKSYEEKLEAMRDTRIPSSRETELLDEIDRYKRELATAINSIEIANASGRKALEHATSSTRPSGEIAAELLKVNEQLKHTSEELSRVQRQREELREKLGNAEVQCSGRMAAQTNRNSEYTKRLEQQISDANRTVTRLTDDQRDLQAKMQELNTKSQADITNLRSKLSWAEAELNQHKTFMRQQQEHLKLQAASAAAVARSKQSQIDYDRRQLEETLRKDFEVKHRDLQERFRAASEMFNERKHELRRVQEKLQEQQQQLAKKDQDLSRRESLFAERQAEYTLQKDQLTEARSTALLQVRRFQEVESEFNNRIRLLTTELMQSREQHRARLEQMQKETKEVIASKNAVVRRLEACEIAQDASVARTQELAARKTELDGKLEALTSANAELSRRCDLDKQSMRSKFSNLAKTLTMCETRLGDYDRFVAENRALRAEAQARLKEVHDNRDALERLRQLEHDHHGARQRLVELEAALYESNKQKQALEATVGGLNANLANLKRDKLMMEQTHKLALDKHEAKIRDLNSRISEERRSLEKKAIDLEKREHVTDQQKSRLQKQVDALQARQEIINNTFLDTIQSGANQVASLLRLDPREPDQPLIES